MQQYFLITTLFIYHIIVYAKNNILKKPTHMRFNIYQKELNKYFETISDLELRINIFNFNFTHFTS